MDLSDEIIKQAVKGDMKAFEAIYRACSGFVYNVAFRVVHTRDEAEEVTQEVFILIHKNLNQFRFQSAFKTWVYRITINTAINLSKKWSKERKRTVSFDESIDAGAPSGIEEAIDQKQNADVANRLLQQLNPDQKACIILRSIEGLSYEEIAQTLKINVNTVRSRLKRARETLMNLRKEVNDYAM